MITLSESLNKFLTFNEYDVLEGLGKISHLQVVTKASGEYDNFNKTQKIISDFDKLVRDMNKEKE